MLKKDLIPPMPQSLVYILQILSFFGNNENAPNEINNENELFPSKNNEYINKIVNIGNHNNGEFYKNKNIMNGYVIKYSLF